MKTCALEDCDNPIPRDNAKYCCQEHYFEWLRQGNAPRYWQGKKRPKVGKKIAAKLKGRSNLALKGQRFPGRHNTGQFKPGQEPWNKGMKMPPEYGEAVRQAMIEKDAIKRGPEHSRWKGGITPEIQKLRHSKQYKEWRKDVLEQGDYTCQTCGCWQCNLTAHHVKGWTDYPELRFVVSNGLVMCRSCHSRLHSKGYQDDSEPEELIEFIKASS